jgi:hypothetical protein
MAPVFGLSNIGRRLVEGVVSLFAILGFLYVPLGRHTGFEHAKAIFSTPAAGAAIDELTTTALGLRQRAMDFISERLAGAHAAAPDAEELKARVAERQPRPVPPKLK